jgi:RsiW-degrading membrane proteinase PrsW (M82 family)
MILGAAVGFGFAAFESAGYALVALFTVDGRSIVQLVRTELIRGLLAPVGPAGPARPVDLRPAGAARHRH